MALKRTKGCAGPVARYLHSGSFSRVTLEDVVLTDLMRQPLAANPSSQVCATRLRIFNCAGAIEVYRVRGLPASTCVDCTVTSCGPAVSAVSGSVLQLKPGGGSLPVREPLVGIECDQRPGHHYAGPTDPLHHVDPAEKLLMKLVAIALPEDMMNMRPVQSTG